MSGLLHIALAKALGAGRIIATDINELRLDAAKKFGADAAIHAREDVPSRIKQLNDGRPADLVVVCAGALTVFEQALKSVDRGGTVLCFAPTEPGVNLSVPINDFWRNGITLLPSYGGSPADIAVAIELIRARRVPVEDMITHRLPLEQACLGFKLVAGGADSIKVILQPHKH
jgi:L-iditol 2-dehydrogenase